MPAPKATHPAYCGTKPLVPMLNPKLVNWSEAEIANAFEDKSKMSKECVFPNAERKRKHGHTTKPKNNPAGRYRLFLANPTADVSKTLLNRLPA